MNIPELTEREQEVVCQMARGLGNHDIAAALNITESTVKFHINRILSKLGVSDAFSCRRRYANGKASLREATPTPTHLSEDLPSCESNEN
ncbi:response regulator transcription factor [Nostoc sp. FACHB-133]|uniref:response regulator transcription factor n=1 Tax=Nostoc sp. FACHB-133 TaxID=2692835 RepID=UPI001689C73F|nr:LuxR C-terminal-related transcriptional regulator [Nostoc sp. FACHB-133]MBD2524679.1 response regulator transcription factor [Nostoc sp. FACHB-133]